MPIMYPDKESIRAAGRLHRPKMPDPAPRLNDRFGQERPLENVVRMRGVVTIEQYRRINSESGGADNITRPMLVLVHPRQTDECRDRVTDRRHVFAGTGPRATNFT